MKTESGFTLIELIVTVAIIGILAAIALPEFNSYKAKAYNAQSISASRYTYTSVITYLLDNDEDSTDFAVSCATGPNWASRAESRCSTLLTGYGYIAEDENMVCVSTWGTPQNIGVACAHLKSPEAYVFRTFGNQVLSGVFNHGCGTNNESCLLGFTLDDAVHNPDYWLGL